MKYDVDWSESHREVVEADSKDEAVEKALAEKDSGTHFCRHVRCGVDEIRVDLHQEDAPHAPA